MLLTIVIKEFLSNLLMFRFSIGFLVCLLLVVANSYVLTQDYGTRVDSHQTAISDYEGRMRGVRRYSELSGDRKPQAFRTPKPLSIFNQGTEKRLGNVVSASIGGVPMKAEEHGPSNPYMAIFHAIDLALVFQVVLSLLALVFAYDAISGEGEDGTLRLMLANAVPRDTVLLGKYLGAMASLFLPVVVSFTAGVIIMVASPQVSLQSADWARMGLMLLASLLYISCFYLVGLFLSCLTRRPTTTLMVAMFVWVFFVLIFPNATVFLVEKFSPIDAEETATRAMSQLWEEFNEKSDAFLQESGVSRPFDRASPRSVGIGADSDEFSWGETINASGFRNEDGVAFAQSFYDFKGRLAVEYADNVWQIYKKYLDDNPLRQAKFALNFSRISPAVAYNHATAILSETDLESFHRFMRQARRYRADVVSYLMDKQAFGSQQWFSDEDAAADVSDLPRFSEQREGLGNSIKGAGVDVGILAVVNVIFFLGGYIAFLRYNIR